MKTRKFYDIVARCMNVPVRLINDESGSETLETWDSFRVLVLLNELQAEYQVTLNFDDLQELRTVYDIKKLLQECGIHL